MIPFPLDSYFPTAAQDESEDRAVYLLSSRCAAKYGINLPSYPGPPEAGTPALTFQVHYLGNLRPITVAEASAYGYQQGTVGPGPVMGDDSSTAPDQKDPLAGLSATEKQIVGGWLPGLYPGLAKPTNAFILNGGCAGAALRAIDGPKASTNSNTDAKSVDYNFVFGLIQESTSRAQASPRFIATEQKWASCMARNGYPEITSISAAITRFDLNKPTTKKQTDTAVQDAKCKIQVGMVALWQNMVRANQKALINKDALQLAAVEQRTQKRVRTAAAVLAKR